MRVQPFGARSLALAVAVAVLVAAAPPAHGDAQHTADTTTADSGSAAVEVAVDPAAAGAIAVVERFSAALATGQIEKAAADLDPDVIVLESGGVEQSRDEYLGGHAKADAAFLKDARVTLRHRRAQASGDLAWVASESEIRVLKDSDPLTIDSTETMVLRRTGDDWKIVHIHWSSRRAGG